MPRPYPGSMFNNDFNADFGPQVTVGPALIDKYMKRMLADQDLDQAQGARDAAASRMAGAVQPQGGRQDSGLSDLATDLMVPGKAFVRDVGNGEPGAAFTDTVASAMPFGLGRAAGAVAGPVGKFMARNWPVMAGGAAGMLPTMAGGAPKLTRAQQQEIEMQKQKAANDAAAAQQAAATQADLKLKMQAQEAQQARADAAAAAEAEQKRKAAMLAEEDRRQREQAGMPFQEKHPQIAAALPGAGMLVASALPFGKTFWNMLQKYGHANTWNKVIGSTERAMSANPTSLETKAGAAQLKSFVDRFPEQNAAMSKGTPLWQTALSGAAPIEGALFPSEVDLTQDHNSRAFQQAAGMYHDPAGMFDRLWPVAALGAATALTGSKVPLPSPNFASPLSRSEGLVKAIGDANKPVRKARAPAKKKSNVVQLPTAAND